MQQLSASRWTRGRAPGLCSRGYQACPAFWTVGEGCEKLGGSLLRQSLGSPQSAGGQQRQHCHSMMCHWVAPRCKKPQPWLAPEAQAALGTPETFLSPSCLLRSLGHGLRGGCGPWPPPWLPVLQTCAATLLGGPVSPAHGVQSGWEQVTRLSHCRAGCVCCGLPEAGPAGSLCLSGGKPAEVPVSRAFPGLVGAS